MATERVATFFFNSLTELNAATQASVGASIGDIGYVVEGASGEVNAIYVCKDNVIGEWEVVRPQEPFRVQLENNPSNVDLKFGIRFVVEASAAGDNVVFTDLANTDFRGRRVAVSFPTNAQNVEIQFDAPADGSVYWPDGVETPPGGSRTFSPGDIEDGTVFQWVAVNASDSNTGAGYFVDGTNANTGGSAPAVIPEWPQTLALLPNPTGRTGGAQFTNGVMPVLQELFPDDPANITKDQIHFYFPSGDTTNGLPSAQLTPQNPTAAYKIPLYISGTDGGTATPVTISEIALAPGGGNTIEAVIEVQLIVRRLGQGSLPFYIRGFFQSVNPSNIAIFEKNGLRADNSVDDFVVTGDGSGNIIVGWANPINDTPFDYEIHGIATVTSALIVGV